MKWRGRQQSSNIDDRRGQGGGGFGGSPFGRSSGGGFRMPTGGGRGGRGGMGSLIGIIAVLGIIWLVTGQNPVDMLMRNASTSSSSSAQAPASGEPSEMRDFVGVVVKETEDLWGEVFAAQNQDYPEPTVVLFTDQVNTACGAADSRTGPFYCPGDQKVYIDLSFYDQLRDQFGAPGDFAQAYVLAHEVGHHIQNITGVLPEFNRRRASLSQEEANAYSVRVELQADCYAGVWANYAGQEDLLDNGDIEEALNAANQIGDDTLQKRMQGYAVPKTFNHGTSAQRKTWFERGYRSGNPGDCDTFSGNV
ncbi:neutral zinc metallopeptidase [Devosia neptuniae]|jgi:predicted metalloprotease|uniref:KPN_02809 family neutral zinc metallopeptidase n=1 Tax=Devosia TaxID=46913 RepID=UPI0022AF20DC|nr:neutral zinc metallopeptidase [Devosia neptuniae]MCZ4347107.1 zinc metallopeptidase [Devosia neptuniae]|tara:strand:+ start:20326 stop:21246 length:921 start_codon:yes stop_codon:yes gene_type:complete